MFALIYNNEVLQIEDEQFEVHPNLTWKDLGVNPNSVATGYIYNSEDDSFFEPYMAYAKEPNSDGLFDDFIVDTIDPMPSTHTNLERLEYTSWDDVNNVWTQDMSLYKEDLKSQLSNIRKSKQTLNVTVNGVEFGTDATSIKGMEGYTLGNVVNGFDVIPWKLPNNDYMEIKIQNIKLIYNKLQHYILSCFEAERLLLVTINGLTEQTEVDLTAGWPSTDITITYPVLNP